MKKKYKATGVLALSVMGAVATSLWPIQGLLGNIIHTGFLAATIGGMADWFAVTAIFRKPLGIAYKTEILIRNRQRIMEAIVEFAGQDLLSTSNVMSFVQKQNVAELLAKYIDSQGKERLSVLTTDIAEELLGQMDVAALSKEITPIVCKLAEERLISPVGDELLSHCVGVQQADFVSRALLNIGQELIAAEELQSIIKDNIEEILKSYEGAGAGRAIITGLLGLDAEKITENLLKTADDWLDNALTNEDMLGKISDEILTWLISFSGKNEVKRQINGQLKSACTEELIEDILTKYISQAIGSRQLVNVVGSNTGDLLQNFVDNDEWQQKADALIKAWLKSELENHHEAITSIIEERLNSLSDEELVEFTEEKVADDLQMIRINGSIVGAIAGMALSVVVYLAGQVITP